MYSKKGPSVVPSDAQAREKLALYVYEYLCHVGAKEAAQTFLNEMHWHKQISVGEPPGFLHSWWCVFWDLYCAAPERRESCDHSSEAKAFHDYGFVNSGYVNGMGPGATPSPLGIPPGGPDGLPPGPSGPHHPGFFGPGVPNSHMRPSPSQQPVSQPSPSMMGQQPPGPFLNPRFPGGNPRGPGGMRLPPDHSQSPFNTAPGGPPLYQDQMGNIRQPGPPGMMPQRMPAGHRMSHMNHNNFSGLRPPPNANMSPGMAPMNRAWPPSTSAMHFADNSPGGQFHGPPVLSNGPPQGPGTPIMPMPSPQMPDSSGSAESIYLRTVSNSGNLSQFNVDSGSNMSEMMMNGDGLDIKSSPGGGPGVNGGTPGPSSVPPSQQPEANMNDYGGLNNFQPDGDQTESAAILEIKNKMAEEAKRFEKSDTPGGPGSEHSSEFFSMQ